MHKTAIIAAITGISAAALLMGAGTALAAGPPPASGSATGTVTIGNTLTLTITSPASFSFGTASAGGTAAAPAGIQYVVDTNNSAGYSVMEAATDFSSGTASFPATTLQGTLTGVEQGHPTAPYTFHEVEGAAGQRTIDDAAPSGVTGDTFSLDYLLTAPANAAPGTYSTTITETAIAS